MCVGIHDGPGAKGSLQRGRIQKRKTKRLQIVTSSCGRTLARARAELGPAAEPITEEVKALQQVRPDE